jgi:16S rRNA (guanine527-N7)-methyltransferase
MDAARIATLLHPFIERTLPEVSLQQISTYIDLLLRWNARINLTAVRDPDNIVTRHFGESLFLARHVFPAAPAISVGRTLLSARPSLYPGSSSKSSEVRVLDIGSGAGFPAVPLKIWAPAIHLTLIESNHKKAAFLREVARELRLTDINVITERAETLASRSDFPPADLVTLRAVEHFETILPLAIRFLAPSGHLALLVGATQARALSSLATGLRWAPPIAFPNSSARVLSIGSN